jgi:hypothetical protein
MPSPAEVAQARPVPAPPSVEPPPSVQAPPEANDEIPSAPIDKRFGHLTVHSSNGEASVYVMSTKYGLVEEPLNIPCGKRFIGIGRPGRDPKEPTWLAPGKSVQIPCGGSLEVTMNPRMLR